MSEGRTAITPPESSQFGSVSTARQTPTPTPTTTARVYGHSCNPVDDKMTLTDFSIESIMGRAKSHRLSPDMEAASKEDNRRIPATHFDPTSDVKLHQQYLMSANQSKLPVCSPATGQREVDEQIRTRTQTQTPKKHRPKNFSCPACPMAFSNNGQLKNHVRIHTGERPFTCNQPDCNKSFTRNEELTRHKMIHTGVRPHICPVCGKRFGRKDHLKKHVRTHQGKRGKHKTFANRHQSGKHVVPDSEVSHKSTSRNVSPSDPVSIKLCSSSETTGACLRYPPTTSPILDSNIGNHARFPNIQSPLLVASISPMASLIQSESLHDTGYAQLAIQNLAHDYWKSWYSLIGFYQQPQQSSLPQVPHGKDELLRRS